MASLPGTPTEPLADAGEVRIANFEHSLYDLHARLIRTEESNTALSSKCQTLTESLIRCHQVCNAHFVLCTIVNQAVVES